jgi:type I restriction enzyme M protein
LPFNAPQLAGGFFFTDASEEILKDRSNSFLLPEHQARILESYRAFQDEESFASVVELERIRENKHSLGIAFYVRKDRRQDEASLTELWSSLKETSDGFWSQMNDLSRELEQLLRGEAND